MATSCALPCMFHNLRKLAYVFSIYLPSWERQRQRCGVHTRLAVPASFWSRRMAPRFFAQRRGGVARDSAAGLPHSTVESSHLLCPLPAFHTASVPDWSVTPEPTTTSSLPLHTHIHTKLHILPLVNCNAKDFVSWDFQLCYTVSDQCNMSIC